MPPSTISSVSCPVYPSEYAYRVSRAESVRANCRRYSEGLSAGLYTSNYVLTDCYRWSTGSDDQLLFIFPTRVSLTTITLHYYSDNFQGLPRLRFYAVPDYFDVWNAPSTSTPHVDVASVSPGREPTGHRNVSININFNTKKVLMYKFSSSFQFTVSEVEFFTCKNTSKYP